MQLRDNAANDTANRATAAGARIAQTEGTHAMIAVVTRKIATVSQSVASMPIATAVGPASAIPIGIRTNEPSAS